MPDLILGCITGRYWLIPGMRGEAGLQWGEPQPMTCDGRPFVGTWRVRPSVADWNGDGAPELLTLDEHGYLALYARDEDAVPQAVRPLGRVPAESGGPLYIGGPNRFPEFTFIGRSKLFAYDWDGDGLLELLIGTHCKLLPTHRELYRLSQEANIGAGVVLIDNVGTPEAPVWGGGLGGGRRGRPPAAVRLPQLRADRHRLERHADPDRGNRGRLPAPLRRGGAGAVPRRRTAACEQVLSTAVRPAPANYEGFRHLGDVHLREAAAVAGEHHLPAVR